jgi:hypothetical protein
MSDDLPVWTLALAVPLATVVSDPTPTPVTKGKSRVGAAVPIDEELVRAGASATATASGAVEWAHPAVKTKKLVDAVMLRPLRNPIEIDPPRIPAAIRSSQKHFPQTLTVQLKDVAASSIGSVARYRALKCCGTGEFACLPAVCAVRASVSGSR